MNQNVLGVLPGMIAPVQHLKPSTVVPYSERKIVLEASPYIGSIVQHPGVIITIPHGTELTQQNLHIILIGPVSDLGELGINCIAVGGASPGTITLPGKIPWIVRVKIGHDIRIIGDSCSHHITRTGPSLTRVDHNPGGMILPDYPQQALVGIINLDLCKPIVTVGTGFIQHLEKELFRFSLEMYRHLAPDAVKASPDKRVPKILL